MKLLNALAGLMVAASLMAAPSVFAADPMMKHDMGAMKHDMGTTTYDMDAFMKSCDMDHDGMMSKAEMLAHMERMFDKIDARTTGKLDKKQAEFFLKQFTAPSGG